jgi:hypothetical protein
MKTIWTVFACVIVAAVLAAGCCHCGHMGMEKHHKAVTNVVYVCPDCHMMALSAGKCPMCQKEMKQMHLLGTTKDGMALVCGCGASCGCDAKGIKGDKCGCGKDVIKVSAKGMYVCPSGCPSMSAMPGKCPCGMEMTKVE